MNDSGSYCLVIRLRRSRRLRIGRLGAFDFPRGYYVYCGSALRGLSARLNRHKRKTKRLHWHVDYLLACPDAQIVESAAFPSGRRQECELTGTMLSRAGAGVPVRGFGASDCRAGCPAHLVHFPRRPALPAPAEIQELEKWTSRLTSAATR